ncbi:hypothetical protein PV10_06241 [Exophiala mesophila]|uniref:Uncharacterized protein n=1 Tax=Exophiala mesophila TaxID=212818 RepID=A0A0D1ZAK5_EXOME|nr:uncharacterized protein PV10_06241 [Exophiala mesophila]KIV91732.1 hypothetical protein PV10_06241 [Exophiala mesophila]
MDMRQRLTEANLAQKEEENSNKPYAIARINFLGWGLTECTSRFATVHQGVELEAHLRHPTSGAQHVRFNVAISEGFKGTSAIITQAFLNRIKADPLSAESMHALTEYPQAYLMRSLDLPPTSQQVEPPCADLLIKGTVVLSFIIPVRVLDPHRKYLPSKLRVLLVLCKYHCIVTAGSLDNNYNNNNQVDMWLPADGRYILKQDGLEPQWIMKPEMTIDNNLVRLDEDAACFRIATSTEVGTQMSPGSDYLVYHDRRAGVQDGPTYDMALFWRECFTAV